MEELKRKNRTPIMKLIPSLVLASVSSLQAAVYNYNMSADNDMTLYSGNITGSSLTEHFNQTAGWGTPNVGSFVSTDNYLYLVGMNFTSVGSFAGFINTIDISTVPWDISSGVSGSLTGYTGSSTAFNPLISEVSSLIGTETFTPAALTGSLVGVGIAGVADSIDIPSSSSAFIYRTDASNFSIPEPSTTLLGFGAATLALLRRRRTPA
jgi:hypothetical protein